MQYDLYLI